VGVLARLVGPPLRGTFAELLATEDPALIERAVALYRERFITDGMFENLVYPGVPARRPSGGGRTRPAAGRHHRAGPCAAIGAAVGPAGP
jgi:hypothetical protein